MKTISLGGALSAPAVAVGCMRIGQLPAGQLNRLIHTALDAGANFFDHADIYGGGVCETLFGQALKSDSSIRREELILQSKCGICKGYYDLSREHILESVDRILTRLQTEYLDVLLLHRPDALVEPEEVAAAFQQLFESGKVRHFGVSNHKPMQIELLKKYVRQPLLIDQLQFSLPVSNMVANGIEVNMDGPGSPDRDGSVLDYCRINGMTIQAWSPFQQPSKKGTFLNSENYPELNGVLRELAEKYGVTTTTVAAAWILRHPANMQLITGTTSPSRLGEILAASDLTLTRQEWYALYRAAGHPLP